MRLKLIFFVCGISHSGKMSEQFPIFVANIDIVCQQFVAPTNLTGFRRQNARRSLSHKSNGRIDAQRHSPISICCRSETKVGHCKKHTPVYNTGGINMTIVYFQQHFRISRSSFHQLKTTQCSKTILFEIGF